MTDAHKGFVPSTKASMLADVSLIEVIHVHFLQEELQMLTKGFIPSTIGSILPDGLLIGAIHARTVNVLTSDFEVSY